MLRTDQGDGASTPAPAIGDLVRVGNGKTVWRIASFWLAGTTTLAELVATTGYARTSSVPDRLTIVERGA
jgi:hypothetical protein